jgi:hypothetical protein
VTRGARSSQRRDRWLGRSGKRSVFPQPSRNGSVLSPVCVSQRKRFHDGWETRRRRLRHLCSRAYHGEGICSCETRNEWVLRTLSPLCTSCLPSRPYVRRVASRSCVIYTLRAHHDKQTSVLTSVFPHLAPAADRRPLVQSGSAAPVFQQCNNTIIKWRHEIQRARQIPWQIHQCTSDVDTF